MTRKQLKPLLDPKSTYFGHIFSGVVEKLDRGLQENFILHPSQEHGFNFGQTSIPRIREFKLNGVRNLMAGNAVSITFHVETQAIGLSYPMGLTSWNIEWYLETDNVAIRVNSPHTSALHLYETFMCDAVSRDDAYVLQQITAGINKTMTRLEAVYRKHFKITVGISRYRDAVIIDRLNSEWQAKNPQARLTYFTKIDLSRLSDETLLDILCENITAEGYNCIDEERDYEPWLKQLRTAKNIGQFCRYMRTEIAAHAASTPDWWQW